MTLLSQPFDPMYVKFTHQNVNYNNLYKRHMIIHSGKTKVNWFGVIGAGLFAGGVATLTLTTTWLMAFLGVLLILLWIVAPQTRIRTQKKRSFLRQNRKDDYRLSVRSGPEVNWDLAENNEIYADAVKDWLNAVRVANSIVINQTKWTKFLDETEKLVGTTLKSELEPNFEQLNTLKELLK